MPVVLRPRWQRRKSQKRFGVVKLCIKWIMRYQDLYWSTVFCRATVGKMLIDELVKNVEVSF